MGGQPNRQNRKYCVKVQLRHERFSLPNLNLIEPDTITRNDHTPGDHLIVTPEREKSAIHF